MEYKKASTYDLIEDNVLYRYSSMSKLQCCDCGLVHKVIFELDGFRLIRDNRATGQVRRWLKHQLVPNPPTTTP